MYLYWRLSAKLPSICLWSIIKFVYIIFNIHLGWQDIMMTSSNGNIFRVTGHLCGNSLVTGEFPAQRPVTQSFYVFFDLHLKKRLSNQWWDFDLRCHCAHYDVTVLMASSFWSLSKWAKTLSVALFTLRHTDPIIFFPRWWQQERRWFRRYSSDGALDCDWLRERHLAIGHHCCHHCCLQAQVWWW